jgi:hypothetical protein
MKSTSSLLTVATGLPVGVPIHLLACLLVCVLAAPGLAAAEPYPSTYEPLPSVPTLIVNATILTGTGERIDNGSLLLARGRVEQVVADASRRVREEDAVLIDAQGRWVTPGLIDVHSTCVYASPYVKGTPTATR